MLDSEYVCLILLLLLNSQKAKTLAITGLAAMIMYFYQRNTFSKYTMCIGTNIFILISLLLLIFVI